MDEDIAQCSNSAAFAISVATEMFIRYLTEQAYTVVKSERKPRRNIAYKDIATAVTRIDNLEFLADVIPKTTTYRQFKEKKAREEAEAAAAAQPGQTTLQNGVNGQMGVHTAQDSHGQQGAESSMIAEASTPPQATIVNGSPIADRTLASTLHAHPDVKDVEMEG